MSRHRRGMLRRARAAAAIFAVTAGLAACGTSGSSGSASNSHSSPATAPASSSAPTASAALCRAADDLRTSLTALQQVDVVQQGTDALTQAFAQVKTDLTALTDAARSQYAQQIQQVKTDSAALQAAVDQAKATPSTQTVGAVATAARTLVQDAQALLATVSASC